MARLILKSRDDTPTADVLAALRTEFGCDLIEVPTDDDDAFDQAWSCIVCPDHDAIVLKCDERLVISECDLD